MNVQIPLALQTLYAELLERCATASFEAAFAGDGVFTPKTIRGRCYWYFQTSDNGKRRQRYVGPETEALLQQIARHKQARDDERERRKLVSTLVRSGNLPRPEPPVGRVLTALAGSGVFRLRGVLVGTIAFQTYGPMLGTPLPAAALSTQDVDIAQFQPVSLAIEDKTPKMLEILQSADASFRALPGLHEPTQATSYESKTLRVDILVPNRGPERDKPIALRALGTDAQPLRFLDFLIHEPEPAVLLHDAGVYVTVPAPQRFALHKLIVARRRKIGSAKSDKDLRQAETLLALLARTRPYDLRAAWKEAYERGKEWRRLMLEGLGMIDHVARDLTLQTAGLPRATIPGLTLQFGAPASHYDFDRDVVVFRGTAGSSRVNCAISREALDDHFGTDGLDGKGRLKQFRKHREMIAELARLKYLEWPIDEPGSVLIMTEDVPMLSKHIGRLQAPSRSGPSP
jgi:hypothetical protein